LPTTIEAGHAAGGDRRKKGRSVASFGLSPLARGEKKQDRGVAFSVIRWAIKDEKKGKREGGK